MRLTLNGEPLAVEMPPGASLLELLREGCGLRSMKDGCAPEGSCGACTVIVDGRPVVSCAQPAERFAGREVLTLEGLPAESRAQWAAAFAGTGGSQCGFCSPGIVMKAEGLLSRTPDPDREEVSRALAGNLCRCTGYVKIVDAILRVAAERRGASDGEGPGHGVDGDVVGQRVPKYEAAEQVLGDKAFVADMRLPGMLHGALRFSDHPRAVVRRIDTSAAAAHPGVVAVLTATDVPGERVQGLITADWPVLVAEGETTRYLGDVLVIVAAETRRAAREAAALVVVEYEVLPPVTDPLAALEADAPALHPGGNLLSASVVRRGDVDAAFADSAHVVSDTFRTQRIEHAFLEPEAALAVPLQRVEGNGTPGLRIYSQGQGAWEDRRQVASLLHLPERAVRVTQVATGGAFGGKEDLSVQGHAALLAFATGRPVLVQLARRESLRFHPKRHPMWLDVSLGADADGHLTALRARIVGDSGAYASVGAKVLERAAGHACGAYRIANVDVEARAAYTNNPPAGAMRGFGVPQVTFAIEGLLDQLAERVGVDGWEIRWRNALAAGDRFGTGQRLGPGVGLRRTLLAVRDAYRSARYAGIACGAKNTGIGNGVIERGRAILRPEPDGSVTLYHSWTEMGQGIHTALAQIAAQELRIPLSAVQVTVDTERELDTGETTASRATLLGGMAVLDAARRLNAARDGLSLADLAGQEFAGEHVIDWTTELREGDPEPATHVAYGWATQVVILDDLGRLARVVAAQDVGRAINPLGVEGQVEGGVHMGLGYALSEEYVVRDGFPQTETLKSLNIIPAVAMPEVESILIEEAQAEGPYGAKGAGEAVLVPTAAAVAGALYRYDGIRRRQLPMTDSSAARAAVPRLVRRGHGSVTEDEP
ncbi:MAG TPA: selenium-dependent xanthine dehydrogenase [Candidatus Limnocylindria bacterium]